MINGILIINKPSGWTSHDVVAKLRGVLKIKRIGHGGTLDPMSTGVLPIFVGRATRAVEFFENADKEYIATIQFGITTDTQDITGTVITKEVAEVTKEELESVIPRFLYAQKQIPPMYSAIKIGGKKLYELARRGAHIERPARDIYISSLDVIDKCETDEKKQEKGSKSDDPIMAFDDIITKSDEKGSSFGLKIACSKGTYIRTLCHDIGQSLGCGAVMAGLERTKAGIFALENAHTIDEVIKASDDGDLEKILLPIDTLFAEYPSIKLSEANTKRCKNGSVCHLCKMENGKYRVYSSTGELLALGEAKKGELRSIKSFFEP